MDIGNVKKNNQIGKDIERLLEQVERNRHNNPDPFDFLLLISVGTFLASMGYVACYFLDKI